MELQGKIKTIHPLEEKGERKFKTQEITLDRTSEYNGDRKENYSRIQLSGANTDQVLNLQLKEGDIIKCNFEINGRFYEKEGEQKYFQTVSAWGITVIKRA